MWFGKGGEKGVGVLGQLSFSLRNVSIVLVVPDRIHDNRLRSLFGFSIGAFNLHANIPK